MHGRERHGVAYYTWETARRHATLVAAEHPKMVYVREDRALARVIEFLQTHLFGPCDDGSNPRFDEGISFS